MSYELFRTDVITNMCDVLPDEYVAPAVTAVDRAAVGYEVERKPVSLIVVNGVPEALKMYIATRVTEKLTKESIRNYFYTLRAFFTRVAKDVDKIDTNDIRVYIMDYQQRTGVTDRTVDGKIGTINTFFEWCVKNGILSHNPCANVKRIKYYSTPRMPLTQTELAMLRHNCKDSRERCVIDLLFSTGLRVSELCALKFEDIDLLSRSVKVMHGKGNKYRMTYMNPDAVVSLKYYLADRTDDCPYVIVNLHGEKHKLEKRAIEVIVKNVCQRAGIDMRKAKPHNLRHTFATVMIQNGAPVQHVQKLLGHAKLETTMIYAKDNDEDIRRTHERCAV